MGAAARRDDTLKPKWQPDYAPINSFMAAHNFHKIVVLRQTEGESDESRELICATATDTFKIAMQKRNLYKRDNN